MIINLNEIPEEGRAFLVNNKTAELNSILADLIGDTPYSSEFFIKPIAGGNFELVGSIRTEMPEQCSRCGLDFKMGIDSPFKELMLPKLSTPRNSKYARANHFSDMHNDDLTVVEFTGNQFDMGEYLHEVVALAEPLIPAPECDKAGNCTLCKINVQSKSFTHQDEGFEEVVEKPFSVLKNLKLN